MPKAFFRLLVCFMFTSALAAGTARAQASPRSQPGTEMGIYTPGQHELYDGRFVLTAGRIYQVGRLNDPPGWDHMDNEAQRVHPVG
ncbi:MAG: hypothetical protein ACE5MH_03340, partial [Terriglobia bacterium]